MTVEAGPPDGPATTWSGVAAYEDLQALHSQIASASWVEHSLGDPRQSTLEALGRIADPVDAIAGWGLPWLLDHVAPLRAALQQLAGDPSQIAAGVQSWRSVADDLRFAADDYGNAVARETETWTGPAGDAYRFHSTEHQGGLTALSEAAATMATAVEGAGLLVALVRTRVRDLIAEFVRVLASRLVDWLAKASITPGVGIAWLIARVTAMVAAWVARISALLQALTASLHNLGTLVDRLYTVTTGLLGTMHIPTAAGALGRHAGRRGEHGHHLGHLLAGAVPLLAGAGLAAAGLAGGHFARGRLFSERWLAQPGGGHMWPGLNGKVPFPQTWSAQDINRHVSSVATNPNSTIMGAPRGGGMVTKAGDPVRLKYYSYRESVPVKVIAEPAGHGIITAHPFSGVVHEARRDNARRKDA